jgi:hypothetical protein
MLKHKVYVVGHILLHGNEFSTTLSILFSLERENITATLQHLATEQSLSQNRLNALKHSTVSVKNESWFFADYFRSLPVFRHGCIDTEICI